MAKLIKIEGIGEAYVGKLSAAGVNSVGDLLKLGSTPGGRKDLEAKTGIRHDLLLEWINHADLFRITGIGEEFSDLLEEAGVDTVAELAQRNPGNLYVALVEKNQEKKLVRRMPSKEQVTAWVEQAKALPRVISY
jgi:predicted flap endonuclease-1-like 5' DNA nuclease